MKINSKKKICIVTPFHKDKLSDVERISLKTIKKHFDNEVKFLVTFEGNPLRIEGFNNVYFKKSFFENIRGYNLLCNSSEFYRQFTDFEYILICQLDVIVLKNCIDKFIKKKVSYIGAPAAKKSPFDRSRKKLWSLRYFCNGGFSLRNVNLFIKVLESNTIKSPFKFYVIYECLKSGFLKFFYLYLKTIFTNKRPKGEYFAKNLYVNKDTFWTYFAILFHNEFKLPSSKESLSFCFDGNPNFFYKLNENQLPMALHGNHNYLEFLNKLGMKI